MSLSLPGLLAPEHASWREHAELAGTLKRRPPSFGAPSLRPRAHLLPPTGQLEWWVPQTWGQVWTIARIVHA